MQSVSGIRNFVIGYLTHSLIDMELIQGIVQIARQGADLLQHWVAFRFIQLLNQKVRAVLLSILKQLNEFFGLF